MRVLVTHNYYQYAGGEDGVFHDETALLEEHGDQVTRFAVRNEDLADASPLAKASLAFRTVWSRQSYGEIRRLIKSVRPDVLHVHNTLPLLSPAIYHAARAENVAVVQTLHNYRLLCAGALLFREGRVCEDCLGKRLPMGGVIHRCYRGSAAASMAVTASTGIHRFLGTWAKTVNRYISMTQFGKSRFVAGGIPENRIVVKPHFVRDAPAAGGGDGGYVLFVGRLAPEKGVDTLLDAWRRQHSDNQLLIVGDGPDRESVAEAAADVESVRLLGQLPAAEVLELMRRATAVVVPSLWYETFGRVVAEAFACGTPAIVSDIGALAELVEDGVTGYRFVRGDALDLASKIDRITSHRDLGAMRRAARSTYESSYSPAANYGQTIEVYRQAIQDAR